MQSIDELFRRIRYYFRRRQFEAELDEEMQHHLAMKAAGHTDPHTPVGDASAAARRRFGNVTQLKEDSRSMWGWTTLEQLAQDLRYAVRGMLSNRTFAALAIVSLALGIGANTAIYSFMDSILLRSLPVPDPGSLVMFKWRGENSGALGVSIRSGGSSTKDGVPIRSVFPWPFVEQLQEQGRLFSSVFAYNSIGRPNVVVDGEAGTADAIQVSGGYFRGTGIGPAYGRLLVDDDSGPQGAPVAVASHAFAEQRFGSAEDAVERSILINDAPYTIVGVTPPGFFGVNPEWAPELYIPLDTSSATPGRPAPKNYYWLDVMARLKPGVSQTQAAAVAGPMFQRFVQDSFREDDQRRLTPELMVLDGAGGLDSLRNRYSRPLWVLIMMAGLILAIACANLANLLLARAASRRKEMAVRLSIGAGKLRVVRQLLTESVLLASVGAALGLATARWGIRLLTVLLANGRENFTLRAELNWHVLAVTAGLALLTGLLFGLAPAIQATRVDVMPALKEIRSGDAAGRRRSGWRPSLGHMLVVAQVAFSLLLLAGAGLFARTLISLQSVELGFNSDNLLLAEVNPTQAGYQGDALVRFYDDLRRRLGLLPGVRSASLSTFAHVGGGRFRTSVEVPGSLSAEERPAVNILDAGPDYFATLEIPLVAGREIQQADGAAAPKVVVVNRAFATAHFGGQNPIGRRFSMQGREVEIVGLVEDARYGTVKSDLAPLVYIPFGQDPNLRQMTFALRTTGNPAALSNTVRETIRQADSLVPVPNILTQQSQLDRLINQEIIFARLCAAFAILALVIACVGLYATMSYNVARRTGEMGIRMALGARPGNLAWMILRSVCWMAAAGIAIGLPIALGTSRFIESFLWGTEPNDPVALAGACLILLGAGLAAGYLPAWRASRIDPMTALRHE